jgi:ADP-ribose pyrophosphatase
MDEDGRCICVTQYRQGIREVTTEFPAGGIEWNGRDSGGTREEQALAAAKRELREETGYISDSWEHLLTVPSDATLSDNYAHIYLAKDCRRSFDQELDRMEFLNVKLYTVREMEEMIRAGRFQQAVHVMAWYMARCLYIG